MIWIIDVSKSISLNALYIVFVGYLITTYSVKFSLDEEELNNASRDKAGWLPHAF